MQQLLDGLRNNDQGGLEAGLMRTIRSGGRFDELTALEIAVQVLPMLAEQSFRNSYIIFAERALDKAARLQAEFA